MTIPISDDEASKLPKKHFSGLVYLFLAFGFWLLLLYIKLSFEPLHYQTVDGDNYVQLSQKIKNGFPYYLDGVKNSKGQYFSPYPPGYPLLLATTSFFEISFPPQLLVHGFLLLILGLIWWSVRLPIPAFLLWIFTDSALELGSYPWSEWSFVLVSVLFVLIWYQWQKNGGFKWLILLLLLALFLFSIRYAAVYLFLFFGWRFLFGDRKNSFFETSLFPGFLFFGILCVWFSVEWTVFGQLTGGDRYPNENSPFSLFQSLWQEIINQLCLFKDLSGSSKASFFWGLGAQAFFIFWVLIFKRKKEESLRSENAFGQRISTLLIISGICYLLFIIPLRWYFYFAELYDFRLLGPGFLLVLLGIFSKFWLAFSPQKSGLMILIYLLAATFFTLPKQSLVLRLQEKIWFNTRPGFGFYPSNSLHKCNPGH